MTAPAMPPTQPPPLPASPVRPLGPMPGTGSGTRPGGPDYAPDPTGLAFDRFDVEDTAQASLPPGVTGWAIAGRRRPAEPITVQVKPCCGDVLINEECDCAEFAEQLRLAPVIVMRPFDLRRLAEEHVTAAEVDQRERGAA